MNQYLVASTLALFTLSACTPTNVVGGGGSGTGGTTTGCAGSGQSSCVGEVNRFTYDATKDRLNLNNLPLDLDGIYARDTVLEAAIGTGALGGFRAYRNVAGAGNYVALYQRSGSVQAGVVASDTFLGYGNGGAMFGSTATVNLPTTGQANYLGNYAGIRVYEGTGANATALGYTTGTASTLIDFNDFDNGGAIYTNITGRQAYDSAGNPIGALPSLVASATQASSGKLNPATVTEVGPGATSATGTLYGIFGGSGGAQIAGVLVLTGPDPLASGRNVKESGAFLMLKQ